MRKWLSVGRASLLIVLLALCIAPPLASGQTAGLSRLQNEDPNNWPMYHRSYDGFRFSPLSQINKDNVKNLTVAWVHQPGAIVQGLESTPLVVDGVMYYIASYNRVFALDAASTLKAARRPHRESPTAAAVASSATPIQTICSGSALDSV